MPGPSALRRVRALAALVQSAAKRKIEPTSRAREGEGQKKRRIMLGEPNLPR
jgi:hypothetical protein